MSNFLMPKQFFTRVYINPVPKSTRCVSASGFFVAVNPANNRR